MKKVLIGIITAMILIPFTVLAEQNVTLNPNDNEINFVEGGSKELVVDGTHIMGKIEFSSSNTEVATIKAIAEAGDDEDDVIDGAVWVEHNSRRLLITAKSAGTATITITGHELDNDDDESVEYSKTIEVTVIKDTGNNNNNQATNTNQNTTTDDKGNPKTGTFIDATLIILGIGAVAGTMYYVNKKRTMI